MTQPSLNIHLSLRTNVRNPDHHLWNNNGTWWCHFTLHTASGTKQRVRSSLRTHDVVRARKRRDELLFRLGVTLNASPERRAA